MNELLLEKILRLSHGESLPAHSYLTELADSTCSVLETESSSYRPKADDGTPGGLLDFTTPDSPRLPVIVVPDLHARTYFLRNILQFTLPPELTDEPYLTVFQALEQKKAFLVCVGDLLHSELRGRERWLTARLEFAHGVRCGPAMTQEMTEGLSLLCMAMELKRAFPGQFHILKGNHENILNGTGNGNFSFRKFADEGEMTRLFMEEAYGDEVLYIISLFEKLLPLAASFPECVISHAEPLRAFLRTEIINGREDGRVISGLTWTENNRAETGSVVTLLRELTRRDDFLNARYLAGHRPVKGAYALRQNGLFVQIHNPERQNIAIVRPGTVFNPETGIVCVGSEQIQGH